MNKKMLCIKITKEYKNRKSCEEYSRMFRAHKIENAATRRYNIPIKDR